MCRAVVFRSSSVHHVTPIHKMHGAKRCELNWEFKPSERYDFGLLNSAFIFTFTQEKIVGTFFYLTISISFFSILLLYYDYDITSQNHALSYRIIHVDFILSINPILFIPMVIKHKFVSRIRPLFVLEWDNS